MAITTSAISKHVSTQLSCGTGHKQLSLMQCHSAHSQYESKMQRLDSRIVHNAIIVTTVTVFVFYLYAM